MKTLFKYCISLPFLQSFCPELQGHWVQDNKFTTTRRPINTIDTVINVLFKTLTNINTYFV